ncbi:MAG: carboxypeptidase-like regulatory domain-containing protein [Petrotogales bacterium]
MAIAFSYTESTNEVVVTGGTEGTPATFSDFVTADRAGVDTKLLDAGSPASDLTLTYAVRPVEDLAIKVKCVVANKTAETDYIYITGKDWRGAAQTESIDISAGNGTYETIEYWSEITNIDCSDNAAGGGTVWADGDLTVTQDIWGVIWDYGDGQYKIDCIFLIGDNTTSTYFKETNKQIVFSENNYYLVLVNAVFHLGEKVGTNLGYQGCAIFLYDDGASAASNYISGSEYLYGSYFKQILTGGICFSADLHLVDGVGEYFSSILEGRNRIQFEGNDISINDTIFSYWGNGAQIKNTSGTFSRVDLIETYSLDVGVNSPTGPVTLDETNTNRSELKCWFKNIDEVVTILNPKQGTTLTIHGWTGENTNYCYVAWTCNIHITDKDGVNLENATVKCEDKNNNEVFSVTTDANGEITEQNINYIRYGDGIDDLIYSPHKFTISKAGYETLILDNITVDSVVDWHLELLPALTEADVRDAVDFGENKTGSLDLPSIDDVEKGVQFDGLTKEGTFKSPAVADVRDGEGYGANDTEFTGILDLPAVTDVRDGIKFDNETKEGVLDLPSEDDVEVGVGYGSDGIEFEGTYLGLKGNNLTAVLEKSVAFTGHLEKKISLTGEMKS